MADITFSIEAHLAILSEGKNGWQKELNKVSWNGRPAKYDIREWSPDHSRMGKGVTLSEDEMTLLIEAINK